MKNLTWKQWVSLAIIAIFIIAEIVFCFINPLVSISGFGGLIMGVLLTLAYDKYKNKTIQK